MGSPFDRLWTRTTLDGDCWISTLGLTKGYSRVSIGRRLVYAHVLAWEALNGAVPPGLELDHQCEQRACWNPRHLEAVSHSLNVKRGRSTARQRAKLRCPKGHAYTPENTLVRRGHRECIACADERSHARRKAQRGRAWV